MKVTVCFGDIRVLVPCGPGDLLVRDLVREATLRFNKATGQGPDTWVGVRALRASSGGILDPDDRLRDVADDRETLVAECTTSVQQPRAAQADGASGSSAGTASPDMFRGGGSVGVGGSLRVPNTESCVEVGAADLEDGAAGLQVRRGSEPTLHQDSLPMQLQVTDQTKRWSAAIVCRDDTRAMQKVHPMTEGRPPEPVVMSHPNGLNPNHFQRHSNRLSMQFSGPGNGVWIDAVEKVQSYGSKSLPRDARRDPLGQDTSNGQPNHRVEDMLRWVSGVNNVASVPPLQENSLDRSPGLSSERAITGVEVPVSPSKKLTFGDMQTVPVSLVKGEKGLGFTITTRDNPTGGHCPIYIKNILPKGAAVMDGRLRAGDRMVSVNGVSVSGLTQQQVVSLLRNTPTNSTVNIIVERPGPHRTQRVEPQQSPKKYIEKEIGSPDSVSSKPPSDGNSRVVENGRVSRVVQAINSSGSSYKERNGQSSSRDELVYAHLTREEMLRGNSNPSSHTYKRSPSDSKLSKLTTKGKDSKEIDTFKSLVKSKSSSKDGRLVIPLDVPVYDSEKAGLGISVKGKVTVGAEPQDLGIFIKFVLNGGAASRDGRLLTNDQLLCVNGVSLEGQSNAVAMETLRHALLHSRPHVPGCISLTIARRTASMDSLSRWKDDTPPNGNDTNSSNDNSNSHNFTSNTVIYNMNADKENNKVNLQVDNNYNQVKPAFHKQNNADKADGRNGKRHASIVTINNNNSWVSNQSDDSKGYLERDNDISPRDNKRDSFEWSRLDGWNPVIDRLTGLRNESYFLATQPDGNAMNGHREHRHVHIQRSPPPYHNVIIEEDYSATRGNGSAPGESGSEGESGAFSRDAVGRRSMSEKRHAAMDAKATGTYNKIKQMKAANAVTVGPNLGMRKSSSLESLQTAIQENHRHPHRDPTYARVNPPLKHWLTDDHHGPDTMVRGSPQQSSLSHKKPSILKSLSTMFRFGKPQKKSDIEIYGRTQPMRSSEKSLSREALERHTQMEERLEERKLNPQIQQRPPIQHTMQSSGKRLDKAEDRRAQCSPPYRGAPPVTTSTKVMDSAWGQSGDYANYDEVQRNLNVRREKLSEVQIGQMRRQVNAQREKADEESRRAGAGYHSQRSYREAPLRPQSNYYEYETAPPRGPGKLSRYH